MKEDHWGDWLFFSRDDDNSGRSAVTSKKLIAQAFYCYSTQILIKSAKVLGREADVKKYTALHEKLVKAFNDEFVTNNGMLVSDSQTAYVLALEFNLLSAENVKKAVDRLVDNINDYGHLTTGFWERHFYVMYYLTTEKLMKPSTYFLEKNTPPGYIL